ncbi:MAG: hypothetical protein WCS72_19835, partial [Deltaproteobacteria bacterium]
RAWAMMRLGGARGLALSRARATLVRAALALPSSRTIAGIFTMRSIPGAPRACAMPASGPRSART